MTYRALAVREWLDYEITSAEFERMMKDIYHTIYHTIQ